MVSSVQLTATYSNKSQKQLDNIMNNGDRNQLETFIENSNFSEQDKQNIQNEFDRRYPVSDGLAQTENKNTTVEREIAFTDTQAKSLGFDNAEGLEVAIDKTIDGNPEFATRIRTNLATILENPEQTVKLAQAIKVYQDTGRDVSGILEKLSELTFKDSNDKAIESFFNNFEISKEILTAGLSKDSSAEVRETAGQFLEGLEISAAKYFTQAGDSYISEQAINDLLPLPNTDDTADSTQFYAERGRPQTKKEASEILEAEERTVRRAIESGDTDAMNQAQKIIDGIVRDAKERGWDDIVKRGEEIGKMITTALDNIAKQEANNLAAERGLVGEIINIDKENLGASKNTQETMQEIIQNLREETNNKKAELETLQEKSKESKNSILKNILARFSGLVPEWALEALKINMSGSI